MNTDEHRFDLLTENVLGAVFEVSNTYKGKALENISRIFSSRTHS
jgi:hypothetical protein